MRNAIFLLLFIHLIGFEYCLAETRHYRTASTHPPQDVETEISVPLIEIDPDSGEKKFYLKLGSDTQPEGLAEHFVYADYGFDADKDNSLHQAIASLHQQMRALCPQGWLKLKEWGIPTDLSFRLHYAFACLE